MPGICRRAVRGTLGVLLALHLGVAQASMLPAPQDVETAVAVAAGSVDASPCHHPSAAESGLPADRAASHCCDAGQCHCPVFLAVEVTVDLQPLQAGRDRSPQLDLHSAPSRRVAPDLRPPIAA